VKLLPIVDSTKDVKSHGRCNKITRLISSAATNSVPALRGHRSGCKSARWFSIDEQHFAGFVFLSAALHPVGAGSPDTARKNAGAIAFRVGLAGILSKATAGRVVRRHHVELVGGTWPQEYYGGRGTPRRHRSGGSRRLAGSAELNSFAISQTLLGRMGRPVDIANASAFWPPAMPRGLRGQLIPVSRRFRLSKKTAITA
jgi:hypothetical protein